MRTLLLASTIATLLAAPALACGGGPKPPSAQVPDPVADIDELLTMAKVSPSEIEQVKGLQAQARALVAAKKYDEARMVIVKAERIMGFMRPNCAPLMFQNRQQPTG